MAAFDETTREFRLCVLGTENVGKTSLCSRLAGGTFSRKTGHKPTTGEEATRYSFEVDCADGKKVLFHLFDWAWSQMRREQNINPQLMRGPDGAIFVYDVTDKKTKTDFPDYMDWYQRASGFDKPWIIVSNKNDQKKKAVQEGEGQALARQADNRAYVPISLVDDSGVDDLISSMSKIMMKDVNLSIVGVRAASEEILAWSDAKAASTASCIGLGLPVPKSARVLLVSFNSSVIGKFGEACAESRYVIESSGSAASCEESLASQTPGKGDPTEGGAPVAEENLPIFAICIPPSGSESQKTELEAVAARHNVKFVVSIPRNVVLALDAA